MSLALLDAFRRDPVGVASHTAIVSFDKENSGALKVKGDAAERLYAVKGESRIVAIDLRDVANALGVAVSEENVAAKLLEDWMPSYYLPWVANGITRTTLRPRSATARDGSVKNIVPLVPNAHFRVDQSNPASPPLDPNDPDIFFTSALNGCTVTVRGSRTEPTVYHGNAKGFQNAAGENSPLRAALTDGDDAAALALIGAKQANMLGKFNRFEEVDPKLSRAAAPPPAQATKVIGQSAYQMLVSGGQVAKSERRAARTLSKGIAREEGGKVKQLRLASSQGTVFGVRRGGNWTFYYQKLVKYEWWRDASRMFERARWEKDPGRPVGFRVVESGEFWPEGVGVLVP